MFVNLCSNNLSKQSFFVIFQKHANIHCSKLIYAFRNVMRKFRLSYRVFKPGMTHLAHFGLSQSIRTTQNDSAGLL